MLDFIFNLGGAVLAIVGYVLFCEKRGGVRSKR
jgi:hypothetical protein